MLLIYLNKFKINKQKNALDRSIYHKSVKFFYGTTHIPQQNLSYVIEVSKCRKVSVVSVAMTGMTVMALTRTLTSGSIQDIRLPPRIGNASSEIVLRRVRRRTIGCRFKGISYHISIVT